MNTCGPGTAKDQTMMEKSFGSFSIVSQLDIPVANQEFAMNSCTRKRCSNLKKKSVSKLRTVVSRCALPCTWKSYIASLCNKQ